MKRLLNPATNPNGWLALAAAAYAVTQAVYGHTAADPRVWLPAVAAFCSVLARGQVTPVSDPKDGNGAQLTSMPPPVIVKMEGDVTEAQVAALKAKLGQLLNGEPRPPSVERLQPPPVAPAVQPPATGTGPAAPQGDTR